MRYIHLTAPLLAAIFLCSCGEVTPNEGRAEQVPVLSSASSDDAKDDTRNIEKKAATGFNERIIVEDAAMPEKYQGLDPKEISQAEINELMALEKKQQEIYQAYLEKSQAWAAQDPVNRGPRPDAQGLFYNERLAELNGKLRIANIRKRYENIDPKILSKAEVEEIISLEQARARRILEHQKRFDEWNKLDPANRGPQPDINQVLNMETDNSRTQELWTKVQSAHAVNRKIDRIKKLSQAHSLVILDNEMSELIELHSEMQTLNGEINQAIIEAISSGKMSPSAMSEGQLSEELIDQFPEDVMRRISELNERIDAIEAPYLAADKAEEIRAQMSELSETSGIPLSTLNVEEAIALNAEKDKIQKRTQLEAERKWRLEGGPISAAMKPVPNAKDQARLKEIDTRLKAISAPMMGTE